MNAETIPTQEQLPISLLNRAAGVMAIAVLLLCHVYLVVCVIATLVLGAQSGLTDADMQHASFLSTRLGLEFHGAVFGGLIFAYGLLNLFSCNAIGLVLALFGFSGILACSERAALQQGVLDGDMRIGCYSYESLECRKMLKLPEQDAPSIYKNPSERRASGYADWYIPVRAKAISEADVALPNTLPGVALLKSPVTLFLHLDELKAKIASQQSELASFEASVEGAIKQ